MIPKLRYDGVVQRLNRATVAGFALVALALFLAVPAARAQVNGPPASVTSPGFGGHPGSIHGTAPSVTSLGPRGYTPGRGPNNGLFGTNSGQSINGHHHHNSRYSLWGGYYATPYYGYDDSGYDADNQSDGQSGDQYNGGPTIFDRRGPGTPAPRPPSDAYANRAPSDNEESASGQPEAAPASDQPQTLLVFKDGHQLEVENYAIVGSTLYDLTEGHRRKIALSELDLAATAKENDDRGIDFQLPSTSEAN